MKIKIIILSFLFIQPVNSFTHCNKLQLKENKLFSKLKKMAKENIIKLSNHREIATLADEALSQLIKVKSPVLLNWIKKRDLDPQTNDRQIAIEWRKYYLNNFVINNLSKNSENINLLIAHFFKDISHAAFPIEIKKKYNSLFLKAKSLSIQRVNQSPIENVFKKQIITRIEGIKLYWFDKLIGSKFEKYPLEFINWGIAYDPVPNEINIGIESHQYSHDETILAVFAHEIGHSIDPCRWSAFLGGPNPFKKIINCLRTPLSANAKRRDDSQMEKLIQAKRLSKDLASSLKLNKTCNKVDYPPIGVQKDQMPEAFADWFSAEAMSLSPNHLTKNLRQDLCHKKQLKSGSAYLTNKQRLERIYLSNPIVSKKLNQKSLYQYCQL